MSVTELKGFQLSTQQTHLWTLQKHLSVDSLRAAISIEGQLNEAALLAGLQRVVDRHEILHTVFSLVPGTDVPMQVVADVHHWSYVRGDLGGLAEDEQRRQFDLLFASSGAASVRLEEGPLLSTWLWRCSPGLSFLVMRLSPLCADVYTLPFVIQELQDAYTAVLSGEEYNVEEPLQYADVSA